MLTLETMWLSEGYTQLTRRPSLFFCVASTRELSEAQVEGVVSALKNAIDQGFEKTVRWRSPADNALVPSVIGLFDDCFRGMGNPDFKLLRHRELPMGEDGARHYRFQIGVACYLGRLASLQAAVVVLLNMVNRVVEHIDAEGQMTDNPAVAPLVADLESRLASSVLPSHTRRGLVKAADKLGIPWREVSFGVFQFGWGRHSRIFESTHSDATPAFASKLAKDKRRAADFLGTMGFPTVDGGLASTQEHALALASQLGYPVVIKPAAADGGESVFTGLQSEDDVRWAFDLVPASHLPCLVEKHFDGSDFRIQIHKDQIYDISERTPAYIIGDGVQTVADLVSETNSARTSLTADDAKNFSEFQEAGFLPIDLDEESDRWLRHQGMVRVSVPESGQKVRLKGAANVSKGGTRRKVPLSEVHPANKAMVVGAVRNLRLDIAGVDLLIPDISTSWQDSGACICEVNNQPQIFDAHYALLELAIQKRGRIGTTLVICDTDAPLVLKALSKPLIQAGKTPAMISDDWSLVGEEELSGDPDMTLKFARRALSDSRIDHMVFLASSATMTQPIPFDHADQLVVLSEALTTDDASESLQVPGAIRWACSTKTTVMWPKSGAVPHEKILPALCDAFAKAVGKRPS